jgi:hypothetical protein
MDVTVPYVLDTPWGTITFNHTGLDRFNSYGEDEFYIGDEIDGLDGAPLRIPTDNRPNTDGGLVHGRLEGPRVLTIPGVIIIRSTRNSNSNATGIARNLMEQYLKAALKSIERADGTLTWTPRGLSEHQLIVRAHDPPVGFTGIQWRLFNFGLIAADPDYVTYPPSGSFPV